MKKRYSWPGYPSCTPREVILDKQQATERYLRYMFDRTQSMFKYDGLPESIPQRMFELYLQSNGNLVVTKVNGTLYAFTGGPGGEPDAYYRPTIYVIANPYLNISKELNIDRDCVFVLNDSMLMGLTPLFSRYAVQLAEVDISLWRASVNTRAVSLVSGGTDATKKAADKFLKDLEAGELGAVGDNSFMESLKTYPINGSNASNYITQLIELRQYWLASWYQDLGLNANHNMKRESINESEAGMNEDALLPLIDDMLKCRKDGVEKINDMFGTDISVELDSAWKFVGERAEQVTEEPDETEKEGEEDGISEAE